MSKSKTEKPITVPFSKSFGEYLKLKRIEKKLSQSDISSQLGYTSSQMVSKWERGLCGPKFNDLVKLTKIFDIESEEMLHILMKEQMMLFMREFKKQKNPS